MSNYIIHEDRVAFHPGYYIKEIVDDSGLTQEDFAKRLGTTPKNLSVLIRGDQNLSIDIAAKLSRMVGTSIEYWLNLQQAFDCQKAEFLLKEEMVREREAFKALDYKYFRENFHLPNLVRKVDEQITEVRRFLDVSSLCVLKKPDFAVSFRQGIHELSCDNIMVANSMVQIAVNFALKTESPSYNRENFEKAVDYALTLTTEHESFLPKVRDAFRAAGVILVVLPNMRSSGINGATKLIDGRIMLMVNDRRHYEDTFWFTLFHEIAHILDGDYGITCENDKSDSECNADAIAGNMLIPDNEYREYVDNNPQPSLLSIRQFAERISRDPGIVLGRLLLDGVIPYSQQARYHGLRRQYNVVVNN